MAYRGGMADNGASLPGQNPRFHEDLVGLDPYDPEALAFAEHLDRIERSGPNYTIEAALDGVSDFADSSNRLRRAALLGVGPDRGPHRARRDSRRMGHRGARLGVARGVTWNG